ATRAGSPDVHTTLLDYGRATVYLRLNLGCETPEAYRFLGSKGILEITEKEITYSPQTGEDSEPSYYAHGFPKEMRESYFRKWHAEHDAAPGKEPAIEGFTWRGVSQDAVSAMPEAAVLRTSLTSRAHAPARDLVPFDRGESSLF